VREQDGEATMIDPADDPSLSDRFPDAHAPPRPALKAPAPSIAALALPDPALIGPLAPGTLTLIRGPRGVGKSWLALAMARAVAAGEDFLGWRGRQAAALHVDAAMTETTLGLRLRALGAPPPALDLIGNQPLDLGRTADLAELSDELPDRGLVVLDGVSRLVPAGRGAASRWGELGDWLQMLCDDGQAVLLVDHAAPPAIAAQADTIISLERLPDGAAVAFVAEIVSRHALPAADRAFTIRLELSDRTARWSRAAAVDPVLQEIADAAREGGTVRDIAARLGLPVATAWRRLGRARALGLADADTPRETSETALDPPPGPAPPPAHDVGAGETGETRPPALAAVSTEVLRRTLMRRLQGAARPEPAIFAGAADSDLLAECTRRLKPAQMARLMKQLAPPHAAE
jgi:hypothetical protein